MTMATLLNELYRELRPKHDTDLAKKLCMHPSNLSLLRHDKNAQLSAPFILRCYDYAGFSIERTRELYGRE
jgi:hypothetical protein